MRSELITEANRLGISVAALMEGSPVLKFAPPSRADLYIEIGPGHHVYYRHYADKVRAMEQRRQIAAHQRGVTALCVGETLDMFQGTKQ